MTDEDASATAIHEDPVRGMGERRGARTAIRAAPLKSLPEPVDLDLCRVRRQARVDGMINEYHLVA